MTEIERKFLVKSEAFKDQAFNKADPICPHPTNKILFILHE